MIDRETGQLECDICNKPIEKSDCVIFRSSKLGLQRFRLAHTSCASAVQDRFADESLDIKSSFTEERIEDYIKEKKD